jgi:hypothetical protein
MLPHGMVVGFVERPALPVVGRLVCAVGDDGLTPKVPVVAGDTPGVGTRINGLTPGLPISTEPNGIPGRVAPGHAGGIAAIDEGLLFDVPQMTALPGNEMPGAIPPPSYVLGLDSPDDAFAPVGQVVAKPVVPASTIIPAVPVTAGLMPGDASSVAPRGIPVGATVAPGVMPKGEAIPGVGAVVTPTCAEAKVLLSAMPTTAIHRGFMFILPRARRCDLRRRAGPAAP